MPTITSNCSSSPIFGGGGPSSAGAYVSVDSIQLIPSPFVDLSVEKYTVGEKVIGGVLKLTLSGTVVADSFDCVITGQGGGTGINTILKLAQTKGCVPVQIQCTEILISGTGRIISASINQGNQPTWVNIAPYTIEIELHENNTAFSTDSRIVIPDFDADFGADKLALRNLSETLSWSINDDTFAWGNVCSTGAPANIDGFGNRHIKVNFSISATGLDSIDSCQDSGGSGVYGLRAAEKYLRKRLTDLQTKGTDSLFDIGSYDSPPDVEIQSAFSQYFTNGKSYLDFRTIEINPTENTINLSGEIIYRPSGCLDPDVFTSLTVEHNLTTEEETITISGNIIGLINNNFDEIITLNPDDFSLCSLKTRIDNAETFLDKINDPVILTDIANCYAKTSPYPNGYIEDSCEYSSSSGVCVTSATPPPLELCDMRVIASQISRNISSGEINFSYTLSNAPNCEILGTTKVDVSITHDKPHDNIVEIIIPGRGSKGPLIQNLCCDSAEKYDINVDATLNRKTCNFNIQQATIDELRNCAERQLDTLVDEQGIDVRCWFKVNDVETIGNNTYKLSRSYVKPSCP